MEGASAAVSPLWIGRLPGGPPLYLRAAARAAAPLLPLFSAVFRPRMPLPLHHSHLSKHTHPPHLYRNTGPAAELIMGHLDLPARRAARLACRAARDALDGRCAALSLPGRPLDALPALGTLAPRLRSLRSLSIEVRGVTAHVEYNCASMHEWLLDTAGSGGFAAALAALPNPSALAELSLDGVDTDALGADPGGVERLGAALANLAGLRRLHLAFFVCIGDDQEQASPEQCGRAVIAIGFMRRLRALAELDIRLEMNTDQCPRSVLFQEAPRDAALLPWRELERVTLRAEASLLLPQLTQPAAAPQLTRLRALCLELEGASFSDEFGVAMFRPLFQAPWLSQLTRLALEGFYNHRVFDALPPASALALPRPLLLPAIEELQLSFMDLYDDTSRALQRLLGACGLGALRSLTFCDGASARGEVAKYAAALTALTKLYLGYKDEWRFDEAGGGGEDARAQQLAAFLAPPADADNAADAPDAPDAADG